MIQTKQLRLMKCMRVKSILKYNENNPKDDSVLLINSNKVSNINTLLGPIQIKTMSPYKYILVDRLIDLSINKKPIKKNVYVNAKKDIESLKDEMPGIKTIDTRMLSRGDFHKNIIYYLNNINNIFKMNSENIPTSKKSSIYWKNINRVISNMQYYPNKTMIINIEEYKNSFIPTIRRKSKEFNPITLLYELIKYNYMEFVDLGNLDIILVSNNGMSLRVNGSECFKLKGNKSNVGSAVASEFKMELFKLMNRTMTDEDTNDAERIYNMDLRVSSITDAILGKYSAVTGEVPDNVKEKVNDAVQKAIEQIDEKQGSGGVAPNTEDIENIITANTEILKEVAKEKKSVAMKSSASSKRDELLREKQLTLDVQGKTLGDILSVSTDDVKIEVNDISKSVDTINKNVTEVRYPNINKDYVENVMKKDILSAVTCLSDKSDIQIYVRNIKVEDSSDINNYKDTYTIDLEDSLRVRHRLVFDVPKFIDNRFLWIGGNKKYINNQQLMLPVVKVSGDTVQLVSNYNKLFVYRYGSKVSSLNEKLKKALNSPIKGIKVINGKYDKENTKYLTIIDYDDLSCNFKEISIGDIKFYFNQSEIRQLFLDSVPKNKIDEYEKLVNSKILPVGKGNKNVFYYVNFDTNTVYQTNFNNSIDTKMSLIDFMLSKSPQLKDEISKQSTGKKYMYTRVKIMNKYVPTILLIAYKNGLSNILSQIKAEYYFSDTRPRIALNESVVEFNDGYLVFSNVPFKNSLLLNGLLEIPTKNYSFDDFSDVLTYQDIFESIYGRRNIANAFSNFFDNFIDPITLEVLQKLSLPTDLTGLVLYANELLVDNQFRTELDIRSFRFRSAELIPARLYKLIASSYEQYKATANHRNPRKISIRKDALIKDILAQTIVEDYSELNPIVEMQKLHGATKKGPSGCNLEEAYTKVQRSFHKSMTGVYTISSSPDGNVGIQRVLTMEPPISDVRGFIDNKAMDNRLDEYNDVNLFGPAEMLTTGGAQRDDAMRTAMSTKQSTHLTPVSKASPSLITNGSEKAIQYHLSKDWSFIAKDDGKVVELNDDTGLMIVEYKNGESDAISINNRIAKNGAGGFYLSKKMIPNYKKGDTFKKNDILAQDRDFFTNSEHFGNQFNIGTLEKIALLSSAATFEDSSYVTKQVSRDMASEIVMQKQVVLGPNTNVDYMVKIGDTVQSGDELIRFEQSFDEDSLNVLLSNVGEDMKEDIMMNNKEKVKTKYSGVIEDIKVYSSVSLNDLSPSLRKVVNKHYNRIKDRRKLLEKYDKSNNPLVKCNMLFNENTETVKTTNDGKFKGVALNDGVLIEFYIKIHDELGAGDKIVFFSALKTIITNVIPEGQEAYTSFRPDEKIGAVLSCNSIIARGIVSCQYMMMGNKLLIELSRQLKDIYEGKK